MYRFNVTIEGTAALMMHRLDPIATIRESEGGKKKNTSAFEGNPEEWKRGTYWTKGVGLFVAADALETCVKQAASSGGYKVGSPKKPARQYVASGLILSPNESPMQLPKASSKELLRLHKDGPASFNGERPDFADMRVVQLKGGRQCRYRTLIPVGWKVSFDGEMLHDEISPDLLQQLISYAGVFKGLYEYRPKFGRFSVASFQVTK